MRPHPAAHPHYPLIRQSPPSPRVSLMSSWPPHIVFYLYNVAWAGKWYISWLVDDASGLLHVVVHVFRNNGRSSVLGRLYENQMPSLFKGTKQSEDVTVSSLILPKVSWKLSACWWNAASRRSRMPNMYVAFPSLGRIHRWFTHSISLRSIQGHSVGRSNSRKY